MARRLVWIGPFGPYAFDDAKPYNIASAPSAEAYDASLRVAFKTNSVIFASGTPVLDDHLVRLRDLNAAFDLGERVLGSVSAVSLIDIAATTIFVAEAGWLVTRVVVVITSSTAATDAVIAVFESTIGNIVPSAKFFGLLEANQVWEWALRGTGKLLEAGEEVQFVVETPAVATAMLATVVVYGIKEIL